jgi:hypothetical protein
MAKHYTVTREGLSKVYENENIRLEVYPKQHQYFEPNGNGEGRALRLVFR